jgi:hypothetical protein
VRFGLFGLFRAVSDNFRYDLCTILTTDKSQKN